ncbi:unnamed protein product [Paramecium primaurelia]|uniref:Uncharacterized protein n=1 Tax=Paramecium primaurelia TaxID=5886 RepID=A0A8S1KCL6_PARPR|nr:unnamed protein product [Paramecium primaurelia]
MLKALGSFYQPKNQKNSETESQDYFFLNKFTKKMMLNKTMIAKRYEKGNLVSLFDDCDGNMSQYDEDILRQLNIYSYRDCSIIEMDIIFVKHHQEILSFCNKIDLISNYLQSNLNKNLQSEGIIFYSYLDQLMAKYKIYLPNKSCLSNLSEDELNILIFNVKQINEKMEDSIVAYRNQLLSALDLDQYSISMYFPNHLPLFDQYIDENIIIEVNNNLTFECIIARKCEIFQGKIYFEGGQHKNIEDLSQNDQEIVKNQNNSILQQLNYEIKIYRIEVKINPMNQRNINNLKQILEGELLQEFCRTIAEQQMQIQETFCSIQIPEADPKQKNFLQEQLPDVEISVFTKLLILKEVMYTIRENQKLLKNPKFKDLKENRENNNKIIQNLIQVLFFKDSYDDKIKPIDSLCGEFMINLCNFELQDFPDIDNILVKLEKLLLLVKSIHCVPLD